MLYFYVPYTLSLLLHLEQIDNVFLTNYSTLFLMIIFVIELIRNKFKLYNKGSLAFAVMLAIYIIMGTIINKVNFEEYFYHFLISFMAPLFCISNLFYWKPPNTQKLSKFIFIIFISNLLLVYIQFLTGFFILEFNNDNIIFGRASGTFSRSNGCAMYLLLFLCFFLLNKDVLSSRYKRALIVLTILAIILTGVRTYLICSIVFVPLCLYFARKEKINIIAISLTMAFLLLPFFFFSRTNTQGLNTGDAENAFQRQLYGLSIFSRGESTDAEKSTLYWSLYVFSEYYVKHPITGCWLLYTKQSYDIVSPENSNVMDAGLAVYLSDIGLLGVILYVFYQLKTIFWRTDKNARKYIWLIYGYIFITTYTDIGIWGGSFTCCAFMTCYLINQSCVKRLENLYDSYHYNNQ